MHGPFTGRMSSQMGVEDQSEAISFLNEYASRLGQPVETIITHISRILLAGNRALKMKRAVRFPYLDFSSAETRLQSCEAELRLNRRTAPSLYIAVHRITRENDGHLSMDGSGRLVDALVEMHRFSQSDLFDSMAQRGALTPTLMTGVARRIAAFHRDAEVSYDHGGAEGIHAVLEINDRSIRAASFVANDAADELVDAFRRAFADYADLLDARRRAGKVRRCHGDLILRNICLFDGVPTMFDCIEFDDALATIDVLYDLSFLLMDLWHREQRDLANLVLNRYLDGCDEMDGLGAVPFFMAIRAAVRAHVTAAQAIGAPPSKIAALSGEAREYFELARSLLAPRSPRLLAIGGLSGSGKSTIAALVASHLRPAPGARVLNSDRVRKGLHGVTAEIRLPGAAYTPEVSEAVYATLRSEAARALAAGCSVIIDAVFDRPTERALIEAAADSAHVPFDGIWLQAPTSTLLARIGRRLNDPSDATADVLLAQVERDCGEIAWRRMDASIEAAATTERILADLETEPPGPH